MSRDGRCGSRNYNNFTQQKTAATLKALTDNGAVVSGANPWDVDTKSHGVKLRGSWDAATNALTVIVVDKAFYVSCDMVWDKLDDLLNHISRLNADEIPS